VKTSPDRLACGCSALHTFGHDERQQTGTFQEILNLSSLIQFSVFSRLVED